MTMGACTCTPSSCVPLEEVKGRLPTLHTLSVINVVIGIVSMSLGIPTVVFVIANPQSPFSSGTGIYTGFLIFLFGVFGLLMLKEAKAEIPSKIRCLVVAVRACMSTALNLGFLHLSFSIWSMAVCFSGDGGQTCGGQHRSANSLLSVFNSIVALTSAVLNLVYQVYAAKVLNALWGLKKGCDVEMVNA
ncbi:uncharacterized protein LOC124150921 isoform X1 [Haliotis rufescens]|uniref:uncharacterized protein LOC124150921 isoform X1 n=1 Tax=Haliotis rufescens TaxID=6454 RepID=UPI00201FA430|nr:uncharacterized protein LOC124150921 isoform X1 [Haliotis rufescens]